MNYKKIAFLTLSLFVIFSCKKHENQIIKNELIGQWLINNLEYTLLYSNGEVEVFKPDERRGVEALVYFNEEGTYQKEDPEKLFLLGGGVLSRTGTGSWNSVSDSIYLDRLKYYDFTSPTGNRYQFKDSLQFTILKSNGITNERNGIKDNISDLLQNYKPFQNLGKINGETEVSQKNDTDYDEGYYQGLYIGYCTGFLNNLVDNVGNVILDRNPNSHYLYYYLIATEEIWSNSNQIKPYEKGFQDGFKTNKGQNLGKNTFAQQKGIIVSIYERYLIQKQ